MNKGFTLVELLVSIIILGLVLVLTVPSYIYVSDGLKSTAYTNKIISLKNDALKYGETIKDDIQQDGCRKIKIESLIKKGYTESDYKTQDALENPFNKTVMEDNLYVCYCKSSTELKSFYAPTFDKNGVYVKGEQVLYDGVYYEAQVKYDYSEIAGDIDSERKFNQKYDENGVTKTCVGHLNKTTGICITDKSTLTSEYILSNFFRKIEC